MASLVEKEVKFIRKIKWMKPLTLTPALKAEVKRHAETVFELLNLKERLDVSTFSERFLLFTPTLSSTFFERGLTWFNPLRKRAYFVPVSGDLLNILKGVEKNINKSFSKLDFVNNTCPDVLKTAVFDASTSVAMAFNNFQPDDNPFHSLLSLWNLGFYPVGPVVNQYPRHRVLNMYFYYLRK